MNTFYGYEVRPLFDPIQTHAVYGVLVENVAALKEGLRAQGATKFRIVKTGIKGIVIVCFKSKLDLTK